MTENDKHIDNELVNTSKGSPSVAPLKRQLESVRNSLEQYITLPYKQEDKTAHNADCSGQTYGSCMQIILISSNTKQSKHVERKSESMSKLLWSELRDSYERRKAQSGQYKGEIKTRPLPPRGYLSEADPCTVCFVETPKTWPAILVCLERFSFMDRVIVLNTKHIEIILHGPVHLFDTLPLQKCNEDKLRDLWNIHKQLTILKKKNASDTYLAKDYCHDAINTLIHNAMSSSVRIFTLKFDCNKLDFKCIQITQQAFVVNKNIEVRRTRSDNTDYVCRPNIADCKCSSGKRLKCSNVLPYRPISKLCTHASTTTWKGFESHCWEVQAFPYEQTNHDKAALPDVPCSIDADSSNNTSMQTNFTQNNESGNQLLLRTLFSQGATASVTIPEDVNMEEDNLHSQNGFRERNIISYHQHATEIIDGHPVSNSTDCVQNPIQYNYGVPISESTGYFHTTAQTIDGSKEYCKHPNYEDFNNRITTYVHWPSFYHQHPTVLAQAGLFYSGNNDCVICYRCGVELSGWSPDDDPVEKHVKSSPDCPYLEQKFGPDKLQFLRDRASHRIHFCSEASTWFQSVADFVSYEGHTVGTSENRTENELHPADLARSPQFAAYNVRLSTFKNWPIDLPQRPPQLADAGFYYTGYRDVVRCYVCDGGLQKWDPNDDPWIEHARWFSTCPYVLRVKGQDFVDQVVMSAEISDEEVEGLYATAQCGRNQTQTNNIHLPKIGTSATSKSMCTDKRLDTAAAQSVLSMGYSRTAVLMALDILCKKDQQDPQAVNILQILLGKEEAGEELPRDSSSPPPQTVSFEDLYKTDYEPPSDSKALLNENQQLVEMIKCLDCHERNKNVLFLPCTHHELCEICAADVIVCPKCWREVKQKVKTFMC